MLIEIKIGGKSINEENLPFIIAEAGLNHNGDLEKALEMISIAKNAGVDAVKFQTFITEDFVNDKDKKRYN